MDAATTMRQRLRAPHKRRWRSLSSPATALKRRRRARSRAELAQSRAPQGVANLIDDYRRVAARQRAVARARPRKEKARSALLVALRFVGPGLIAVGLATQERAPMLVGIVALASPLVFTLALVVIARRRSRNR